MPSKIPLGGPLQLFTVSVIEPLSSLRFASPQDYQSHLDEGAKAADGDLWAFLDRHGLTGRVEPQTRVNRSTFASEIEQAASELRCDVIIIGTSEKSFLEKLAIGSVSEAVVREVQADIIIVP